MKIDDFIIANPQMKIENISLKNAIIFKIQTNLLDKLEIEKLNKEMRKHLRYLGSSYDRAKTWYNKKEQNGSLLPEYELQTGEAGMLDLSDFRAPYKNIIFILDYLTFGLFWLIELAEDHKNIKYSFCHLCDLPYTLPWPENFNPNEYGQTKPKEVRMDFYYDKEKRIVDLSETFLKRLNGNPIFYNPPLEKVPLLWHLFIILKIVQIINCKNVEKIKIEIPNLLQKNRIRKGKLPLLSYYTLRIKLPSFYQNKKNGRPLYANRLHLCRGHFKTYTNNHPLFGKFVGKYWWQAFARGRKEKGIIMKDYQIEK